jgi:hypothetical protein
MKIKYILAVSMSLSIVSCATREDGTKTFLSLDKQQWISGVLIPTGKATAREAIVNYADTKETLSK